MEKNKKINEKVNVNETEKTSNNEKLDIGQENLVLEEKNDKQTSENHEIIENNIDQNDDENEVKNEEEINEISSKPSENEQIKTEVSEDKIYKIMPSCLPKFLEDFGVNEKILKSEIITVLGLRLADILIEKGMFEEIK